MNQQPVMPLSSPAGVLLLNMTQFSQRRLLQFSSRKEEEEAYFLDYIPPSRDAIKLPRDVVYVLAGVALIIVATYAIVGHLIKDLMHDLADWIFGPKPAEEDVEEGGGGEEEEEERRLSVSSKLMETGDKLSMAKEKEMLLPGFHQGNPSFPPPLRSVIVSSYSREKRMSTHSVTFAPPHAPFVTSL